ncbi:ATP-binding protein [Novosphingobium sp.]|uniref:hybrid sensor histidine kinase/response regulator n=1 Tax=Novosphingobium sp. TaxID=1874826 RepID=UPI003340B945
MLGPTLILASVTVYLALLIHVGWRAERRGGKASPRWRGLRYGLSLATLCSAWTYFGGVGDASQGSWLFAANAMGPILAVTLLYPVWRRIAVLSKQENVGSLADFLAARYGKSRALGILATCVSSLGALPYLALQLKVLTSAWNFSIGGTVRGPAAIASGTAGAGTALAMMLVLVGVAIVFGARRPSLTQHSRGFVGIIALESCVKLAGLLGVAVLCGVLLMRLPGLPSAAIQAVPPVDRDLDLSFLTLILLCTVTAFTLPRQFHLGFVTLEDVSDIRVAALAVPVYFGCWVVATLVIATAIRAGFGAADVETHLQVLAVPMHRGGPLLAMAALIGGLSAGGGMVIVETTAIAAMVSNEIVLPLFGRWMRTGTPGADLGRAILTIRRVTTLCIALLAWLYFLGIRELEGTMQLGLTALTAFAQLSPALLGGIYWRRGHARGAIAGIVAGMAVWALTLAGPDLIFARGGGGAGINGLWPNTGRFMPYGAVLASLAINTALFVLVSWRSQARLIDTIQANTFVASAAPTPLAASRRISATIGDLRHLLAQFLGAAEADKALLDYRISTRAGELSESAPVSPTLARSAERLLAGVIGAPSARNVVAIALAADSQDAGDISRILDEAGHAVHFSRELLQTTLDSLAQGVSVVDSDLQLVAWNTRWLQLMGLGQSDVHIGKSLSALIGSTAQHAGLRAHLASRLDAIGSGRPLLDEIHGNVDGRTLQVAGRLLGQTDYLITLADVTDAKAAAQVLARSNEELEALVSERTAELTAARHLAEQATGAQKRFVAAASHDLVQPLHAARLFIGNALVGAEADPGQVGLLERADQAVEGAHRLLRALLNLSQLETGALKPRMESVDVGALLASLGQEFIGQAVSRGLELIVLPTKAWVLSDRDLLRSMLQNLLVNALRYTPSGRVVMAVRPMGECVRIEVRDSGVGIAPDKLPAAFGEYSRLPEGRRLAEGAGLGLSIVARIAQMLDHPLTVRSRPGAGSTFCVIVGSTPSVAQRPRLISPSVDLAGLRVLCIDDEADVLLGTTALIERWGGMVTPAESAEGVPDGIWDVALADYHLGGSDGLAALRALAGRAKLRLLVTATSEEDWAESLATEGIGLFNKPVAPLALRAVLAEAALSLTRPDQADRSRASANN